MASAGVNMPGGDGAGASSSSSAQECRRRRLAPPRSKEKRVRPSSPSSEEGDAADAATEEEGPPPPDEVAFGWMSVAGRSREMEDAVSLRPGFCSWVDGEPMHFFGVFDGHGGSHVSTLCRERMHELAAEAAAIRQRRAADVAAEEQEGARRCAGRSTAWTRWRRWPATQAWWGPRPWWPSSSAAGSSSPTAATPAPCSAAVPSPSRSPSTTSRSGRTRWPDRGGILAMTRALGDRMLRPEVIAEPEITVTERTPDDECLILASDGMWDVISNEVACSVARQCLHDHVPADDGCSTAASLLVRLALARATWDNVSVVVIHLKHRG